jgi:hypothetical protein
MICGFMTVSDRDNGSGTTGTMVGAFKLGAGIDIGAPYSTNDLGRLIVG